MLVAVTIVAVLTKFAGAFAGALRLGRQEAAVVGVGMVPEARSES